jgi:hypothetical protein
MGLRLSKKYEKIGGAGLRARQTNRRPGTAAPPEYGLLKNFSGQSLMSPWLSQNQEKPGGTGVPPVQAQVENLCHQEIGAQSARRNLVPSQADKKAGGAALAR